MNYKEMYKNTYRVLTEETKKRQDVIYTKWVDRSGSIKAHLDDAKSYGKIDAAKMFNLEDPQGEILEDMIRYALCRAIIYVRNLSADEQDKFDLITLLIKDWKFGYSRRNP